MKNDIRNRLILGNKLFLNHETSLSKNDELMKALTSNGQHPFAVIVCCSDSRVDPELIFDAPLGSLFVIRSAGNVIGEFELASVEYAASHLHVDYVLILGHTHCGAIHSTIHEEAHGYIKNITDHIHNNINEIKDEYIATKENANKEAIYLKEKLSNYQFDIETAIYDIENGKVIFQFNLFLGI